MGILTDFLQDRSNDYYLRNVSYLMRISDVAFREELTGLYNLPDLQAMAVATVLNAIYTDGKPTFFLSRRSFSALIEADKNLSYKGRRGIEPGEHNQAYIRLQDYFREKKYFYVDCEASNEDKAPMCVSLVDESLLRMMGEQMIIRLASNWSRTVVKTREVMGHLEDAEIDQTLIKLSSNADQTLIKLSSNADQTAIKTEQVYDNADKSGKNIPFPFSVTVPSLQSPLEQNNLSSLNLEEEMKGYRFDLPENKAATPAPQNPPKIVARSMEEVYGGWLAALPEQVPFNARPDYLFTLFSDFHEAGFAASDISHSMKNKILHNFLKSAVKSKKLAVWTARVNEDYETQMAKAFYQPTEIRSAPVVEAKQVQQQEMDDDAAGLAWVLRMRAREREKEAKRISEMAIQDDEDASGSDSA